MKYKVATAVLTGLMAVSLLSACGDQAATAPKATSNSQAQSNKSDSAPVKKQSAKAFDQFTAEDLEGNTVTQDVLKEYDLTVLNIWGTFCGPCIKEMPHLGELSKEFKEQGVQFIGVVIDAVDYNGNLLPETVEEAKRIVSETGADYLHLLPSDDLNRIKLNQVTGVPETVFLDSEGNVIDSVVGAMEKEDWAKTISMLLERVNG